jgi:hypothetical protein
MDERNIITEGYGEKYARSHKKSHHPQYKWDDRHVR